MSNQFGPTYPGGFSAIVQQMESRLDPLDYADGEGLIPLACDLGALQHQLIDANGADVPRSKSGYARKFRELAGEFHGQPALLHLHGLLIAHLRRRSQPAHTAALFLRLWAEHAPFLLAHLDCRWQVSAITTFGDHGASAVQRQLGQSLSVLFATMKLYETERLYSGLRPDQPHSFGRKSARHLPMGMDAYALKGGGLDVNLLGKLWQQAGQDRVIAPLAQSLLEQLIADPGGVFRRLRMMRAERAERKTQPPTTPPTAPAPAPSQPQPAPALPRWGTVSLAKGSLGQIAAFAAYHLDQGAHSVHLYLDAPSPDLAQFLGKNPAVRVIPCTPEWWATQKKPRHRTHQLRQSWVATHCYHSAQVEWLAHIDIDEFLLPTDDITHCLAKIAPNTHALRLPPVEQLAGPAPEQFKLTPQMAGQPSAVLHDIYPTYGPHLRGGFVSHTEGKVFMRTGITGLRMGIHICKKNGAEIAAQPLPGLLLGHAHAPTWEKFLHALPFRRAHGSYRVRPGTAFQRGHLLGFLLESEGPDALRDFFTEVCTATPELTAALAAHNMLLRRPLNLDSAIARHFGPLPATAWQAPE